jgi:hypothetical protein
MLPQNLTLQDHHVDFTIDYVVQVIPRSKKTKTARNFLDDGSSHGKFG